MRPGGLVLKALPPWTVLVGGIPTPLKNMKVNWDDDIPKIWKHKNHVPNHQPDIWGSPKMEIPQARWMVYFMENRIYKWMITRGIPILGNPHKSNYFQLTISANQNAISVVDCSSFHSKHRSRSRSTAHGEPCSPRAATMLTSIGGLQQW